MSKAKQILMDLNTELQGKLLSDVFTVNGRDYEMQLLTDAESTWVFSHIKTMNTIILALTSKTATLSAGIRKINGCTISEIFEDEINEILSKRANLMENYDKMEKAEAQELVKFLSPYDGLEGNVLVFKLFFDWLGNQPSKYVDSLYKKWEELSRRQAEMQDSVKKSSQGSSVKSTEANLTDPSQGGNDSTQE